MPWFIILVRLEMLYKTPASRHIEHGQNRHDWLRKCSLLSPRTEVTSVRHLGGHSLMLCTGKAFRLVAFFATATIVLAAGEKARAAVFLISTRQDVKDRAGSGTSERIDWGQVGPPSPGGVALNNPFTVTSSSGFRITVSNNNAASGSFFGDQQGPPPPSGNVPGARFTAGDRLIDTFNALVATPPPTLTLDFPINIVSAGAQFNPSNTGADFTVSFQAFDANGVSLGTVTSPVLDIAGSPGDNSAPFVGIVDTAGSIRRLLITVTPLTGPIRDFEINQFDFVVPEPTSIALFGLGLASFAGYRWRRRKQLG